MNPGRELDFLIAEKIMGWTKKESEGLTFWYWPDGDYEKKPKDFIPDYSTDIANAWLVIENRLKYYPAFRIIYHELTYPNWFVSFTVTNEILGSIAAHAICLAALETSGIFFSK